MTISYGISETQPDGADRRSLAPSHTTDEAHGFGARGVDLDPAMIAPKANDETLGPLSAVPQLGTDAQDGVHCTSGNGNPSEGSNRRLRPSTMATPQLHDATLLINADLVDDLERVRISTENRVRSLIQVKGLEDGPEYGRLTALAEALKALEHSAILELQRTMRSHPLGPWVKETKGVGLKQAARLLAAIGNPAERPNVAKLWAYCGFHVIDGAAAKRRKGEQANWSNIAKMRARLIAESCIKHRDSPYRSVYDDGRKKYEALDISDLHKHNRALRLVAKAMLRDLWIESRRVHLRIDTHPSDDPATSRSDQATNEGHCGPVAAVSKAAE